TRDDYYLYELRLRLPGGKAGPVGVTLRRGEDPAKIDLELAPGPPQADGRSRGGGDAGGTGGTGGAGGAGGEGSQRGEGGG
ncbi:MAG TPA: hypothetical protein VJA16_21755, partial [Thermoanaerobaculia bacterium]